jgi:hypothetical protein
MPLILLISIILVATLFVSSAIFVSGIPGGHTEIDCDYEYYKTGERKWQQCCVTDYDHDGVQSGTPECFVECFNKDADRVDCKKVLMEGTFNPDITGGAGAGILQDENKNNSKDTNIGNAGVLQDRSTTNNSNNISKSFGKGGSPLIDKNKLGGSGTGVSPYIGDSSTWCKNIGGEMTCTCRGGTDCLHCGVYTGLPCTDTSKLPGFTK